MMKEDVTLGRPSACVTCTCRCEIVAAVGFGGRKAQKNGDKGIHPTKFSIFCNMQMPLLSRKIQNCRLMSV
jgi:hypothetical protein